MRLVERFADRKARAYHSTFATTFSLDFGAVEQLFLPNAFGCGSTNIVVVADPRMATMALSSGLSLPRQLGLDYELVVPAVSGAIFHPKLVLQLGRDGGRLFVSSANLTSAGMAGNLEVAVELDCTAASLPELALVKSAWDYLDQLVPSSPCAARDAVEWARQRSPWLRVATRGADPVQLDDGTFAAFLARPDARGIGERIIGMIGSERTETLAVVSPYWDEKLEALSYLRRELRPARTAVLLDPYAHDFPSDAPAAADLEIIDVAEHLGASRFKHAKVILAQTDLYDHLVVGSANCTTAALGKEGFGGSNAEAVLYRRFPRGAAAAALGLDEILNFEPIKVNELTRRATEPIPLQDLATAAPGAFELEAHDLRWKQVPEHWASASLQLLDHSLELVEEISSDRLTAAGKDRIARVSEDTQARAFFVRARQAAQVSAPAHISRPAVLKAHRREPTSGNIARALAQVAEGDLGLLVQEAFEELCRADLKDGEAEAARRNRAPRAEATVAENPPRVLTYEEFMRSQPRHVTQHGEGSNTLAGSHCDTVRELLNKLTGQQTHSNAIARPRSEDDDDDFTDDALANSADEEAAQREGDSDQETETAQVRVDAALFQKRVRTYCDALQHESGPLGPGDVLRFRLWLLIVLHHAKCESLPQGLLPRAHETGWPRMIIRLLSAFFCKPKPALARVVLGSEASALPQDFAECWATALWAVEAVAESLAPKGATGELRKMLPALRRQMRTVLVLDEAQLKSAQMSERFEGLDATLGVRLVLKPLAPEFKGAEVVAA